MYSMKKLTYILIATLSILLVACGPSAEENALAAQLNQQNTCRYTVQVKFIDKTTDTLVFCSPSKPRIRIRGDMPILESGNWGTIQATHVKSFKILKTE